MAKEIRVPALGESVTEATIAKWFKKAGEAVKADEPLVGLHRFARLLQPLAELKCLSPSSSKRKTLDSRKDSLLACNR